MYMCKYGVCVCGVVYVEYVVCVWCAFMCGVYMYVYVCIVNVVCM